MTDYMKEAERLTDAYAVAYMDFVRCGKSDHEDARAALLAHIKRGCYPQAEIMDNNGRGAVPEGWQVVPEIASDVMQRTFLAQPGTHTEFTHTALQCADFDSRYAAMLAAAPAPGDCPNCFEGKSDMDAGHVAEVAKPPPRQRCRCRSATSQAAGATCSAKNR